MKRSPRFLLVAMLSLLLPLRAVASVSIGLCAAGQEQVAAQAHSDHEHGAPEHDATHHDDDDAGGSALQDCSYCAEHCVGITFVAAAAPGEISSDPGAHPVASAHHFLPGVVPVQLERPPLAS